MCVLPLQEKLLRGISFVLHRAEWQLNTMGVLLTIIFAYKLLNNGFQAFTEKGRKRPEFMS